MKQTRKSRPFLISAAGTYMSKQKLDVCRVRQQSFHHQPHSVCVLDYSSTQLKEIKKAVIAINGHMIRHSIDGEEWNNNPNKRNKMFFPPCQEIYSAALDRLEVWRKSLLFIGMDTTTGWRWVIVIQPTTTTKNFIDGREKK